MGTSYAVGSLVGTLVGALLVTLVIYAIVKAIAHKLGATKPASRLIAFISCAILCFALASINMGILRALVYVGAALFWVIVDSLRKEK